MAARDGVPVRDVLVADASRRTTALNAYVSGLGPTRRIVVYDTLLREAPPAEVEAVVAHELGHAKDGDVLDRHADRGARRGRRGRRAVPARLVGGRCCAGPASTRSPNPGRSALLVALAAVAGLVAAPVQSADVPPGRGAGRRARAGAHRRPGHLWRRWSAGSATANLADPDPPRWEYLCSPRIRRRWSGWPPPALTPGRPAGEPHPAGHQRLSAPPGRDPAFVHNLAVRQPAGSLVVYALHLARAPPSSTPSSRSR